MAVFNINNSFDNPIDELISILTKKYSATIYPVAVFNMSDSPSVIFTTVHCAKLRTVFASIASTCIGKEPTNKNCIGKISVDGILYYFNAMFIRNRLEKYLAIQILFVSSVQLESKLDNHRFADILSDIFPYLVLGRRASERSAELAEFVRNHRKFPNLLTEKYVNILNDIFSPTDDRYFTKIDDVTHIVVQKISSSNVLARKFKEISTNSEMYAEIKHNSFSFLIATIMSVLSKYSLRGIEVDYLNTVTRLDIYFKANFHNSFFAQNPDFSLKFSEVVLSEVHPAFADFEFLKRIANLNGIEVSLTMSKNSKAVYRVSISKTDRQFSNVLMTNIENAYVEFNNYYVVDLFNS